MAICKYISHHSSYCKFWQSTLEKKPTSSVFIDVGNIPNITHTTFKDLKKIPVCDIIMLSFTYKWFTSDKVNMVNTLRPRQNGRHFADDTFKRISLNENVRISINISLKFVPKGLINNIPALVQIMAWRRPGDKPLSEPMMVTLLTHICVTRPQWVNVSSTSICLYIRSSVVVKALSPLRHIYIIPKH